MSSYPSTELILANKRIQEEMAHVKDLRAENAKLREIIGRDQLGKACIYWMDRYHKLAQSDGNPGNRQTISVPKSLIPDGGKLVECYETEREFVICGDVDSDDESHNCDAMGCGSFSHVIARIPKVDLLFGWPSEQSEQAARTERIAELDGKLLKLHEVYGGHLYFLRAPSMQDGFRIAAENIKELRAENAKLHEALGNIVTHAGNFSECVISLSKCGQIARQALAGKEGS